MKTERMEILQRFSAFTDAHRDVVPKIEKIILTEKQNRFQFVGGQIIDDCLFGVVNSAEKMLCYHLCQGEMSFIGSFPTKDFKWSGGCVFENKLYMFPRSQNSLLCYDPGQKAFEEIFSPFPYEKEHHYGGVCTKEGLIYQPPRDTDHLLKWDIKRRSCQRLALPIDGPQRYCASVLHPDGHVYFLPERGSPVLRMSLTDEKILPISESILGMTFDPAIAPDGNLYGFRSGGGSDGKGILKIETSTGRVSVLHADVTFGAYGSKLGPNGKLYSLPGYTDEVWEFDPLTEALRQVARVDSHAVPHYAGGATDEKGDIYAMPVYADHLLRLSFSDKVKIPSDVYECFYRDFY